ncbi:hypothetical protein CAB17_08920 [Legionella sainthelensi]|uniref:Uncharacterized protein n=2 Tax=Legionella sainthelensi TaxID=28087 RepID=A0A2H5FKU3_9GAMM|nr:hypothetical protein CAB17_08920 [Legionella sainthelensi]
MKPIHGITPFGCTAKLGYHESCVLTLQVDGHILTSSVEGGPILCEHGNPSQCYQPRPADVLHITLNKLTYTVVAIGDLHVSATPSSQVVNYNSTATIIVNADSGYAVTANSTCGGSLVGNVFTTGAVTSNCTVIFSSNIRTFTVNATGDAHVSVIPPSQTVTYNSTAIITVNADPGYTVTANSTCGGSLVGNVFTTEAVTSNCSVSFSSTIETFTVSAIGSPHINITPPSQIVNYNSTAHINVTPDAGYTVTANSTCGGSLVGNVFTTGPVTSNCTVHFNVFNWDAWTEYPADPIFNPGKAYYPSVIYNEQRFGDNSSFYKMWYEGNNEIGLAYSDDGINWTPHSMTGLPAEGAHPDVIYDVNGFGGGIYTYKMWFWDPNAPLSDISAIKFSESTDGINWTSPISISQDPSSPLVTGISPGYFYHLYGPGYVIYNPNTTPTTGQPMTYPYVMFFDTSTEGLGPGTSVEQLGLAYSTDGLFWTRYGTEPVIIPSGDINQWDGQYIYQPSLIKVQGIYQLFYSGSNGQPIGSAGNTTAHGIGHASSIDGINWTLDSGNPIFYILDGVSWRNNRTYTPTVIFEPFCTNSNSSHFAKMWFSGANSSDIRAIGYATIPCP